MVVDMTIQAVSIREYVLHLNLTGAYAVRKEEIHIQGRDEREAIPVESDGLALGSKQT